MKDIALIGFMGCGKSSVGKCLSGLLPQWRLTDLDSFIEARRGMSIPEIFNEYGEEAFRRMELEALEDIFSDTDRPRTILSLGGGTVTTAACSRLVRENAECFYLRATTDTLLANLEGDSEGRPMLARPGNPAYGPAKTQEGIFKERESLRERIESLMSRRSEQYESAAHHIIDTDGLTFEQTAGKILNILTQHIQL